MTARKNSFFEPNDRPIPRHLSPQQEKAIVAAFGRRFGGRIDSVHHATLESLLDRELIFAVDPFYWLTYEGNRVAEKITGMSEHRARTLVE